jgi:hypothetical protein
MAKPGILTLQASVFLRLHRDLFIARLSSADRVWLAPCSGPLSAIAAVMAEISSDATARRECGSVQSVIGVQRRCHVEGVLRSRQAFAREGI